MLEKYMNFVKTSYDQYKGYGMYLALFFISILYIFLKEKDNKKRVFFVYYPIIASLIIINPLFVKLGKIVFTINTYSRMFWIIPIGVVIAYAAVLVINDGENRVQKIIISCSFAVIIMLSGSSYFKMDDTFFKYGNLYKIPDESVLIAQLIGVDEEENKKALVPGELTPYIRQIDATIELLYGRTPDTAYWSNPYATELDNGNVKYIVSVLEENNCNYVVFKRATVMQEPIQDYGYEMINESQNYVIYKKIKNSEV